MPTEIIATPRKYSFTALDQYAKCPLSFYYKYEEGLYPHEETLPLSLGSLCHKAKELCSIALMKGERPDYIAIVDGLYNSGFEEEDTDEGKPREDLIPVSVLRQKYTSEWETPDEKSGLTYDEKMERFCSLLSEEEQDTEWRTIGAEVPFHFSPREGIIIRGYIDKVQEDREGNLRIVDYKTSKKVYDRSKLTTPLQLYIYHLACQELYPGKHISEYLYDFILLGEKAKAGSLNWLKKCDKKLNDILDGIEKDRESGIWRPKPTPLCHWCAYCAHNPNAPQDMKETCDYFSNWTPEYKQFSVNQPFEETDFARKDEIKQAAKEFKW